MGTAQVWMGGTSSTAATTAHLARIEVQNCPSCVEAGLQGNGNGLQTATSGLTNVKGTDAWLRPLQQVGPPLQRHLAALHGMMAISSQPVVHGSLGMQWQRLAAGILNRGCSLA